MAEILIQLNDPKWAILTVTPHSNKTTTLTVLLPDNIPVAVGDEIKTPLIRDKAGNMIPYVVKEIKKERPSVGKWKDGAPIFREIITEFN